MKTLAVIKNDLFKDYLRFVSTSDLPSVLDNPDIPVPFTCLDSVENQNADALLAQLKGYFNRSKINNKDFYTLDEDTTAQLQFMLNLIKLSSGQAGSSVEATAPVSVATPTPVVKSEPVAVVEKPVEVVTPVVQKVEPTPIVETPVEPEPQVVAPVTTTVAEKTTPPVETPVEDVFNGEEDDPFGFRAKAEVTPEVKVEATPVIEASVEPEVVAPVVEPVQEVAPAVEVISALGIPKGATIQFIKDPSITATLLEEKTVSYEGQNMTLVEAAKAAFKKSGTVGMAVGLSNWNYEGETLKAWKEKQLN